MNENHLGDIKVIELKSQTGFCVEILTFGAIITKIMAIDKSGHRENVVLEYETTEDYFSNPLFLGCIVGPVAGRTSKGEVIIGDQFAQNHVLKLDTSCHPNSLHSCKQGLHKVNWTIHTQTTDTLVLTHEAEITSSQSGHLTYTLTYKVNGESLTIDYYVTSTALTYLSLTNHSYFNLSGNPSSPISNHHLQMNCSHFVRLDSESLPIELVSLTNSAFDFTQLRVIDDVLKQDDADVKITAGIDHPFKCMSTDYVAVLTDPVSGRTMHVATTQPYMVVYSGNFIDAAVSNSGKCFVKYAGICFETQDLPNITHNRLDEVNYVSKTSPYSHKTTFSFSTM